MVWEDHTLLDVRHEKIILSLTMSDLLHDFVEMEMIFSKTFWNRNDLRWCLWNIEMIFSGMCSWWKWSSPFYDVQNRNDLLSCMLTLEMNAKNRIVCFMKIHCVEHTMYEHKLDHACPHIVWSHLLFSHIILMLMLSFNIVHWKLETGMEHRDKDPCISLHIGIVV